MTLTLKEFSVAAEMGGAYDEKRGICFPTAGAERGRHVEPGGRKLTAAVTTRRPRAGLSLNAPFVTGRGRCVESTHHGSLCPILQPWRKTNTSTGTAFRDPPRPPATAPWGRLCSHSFSSSARKMARRVIKNYKTPESWSRSLNGL